MRHKPDPVEAQQSWKHWEKSMHSEREVFSVSVKKSGSVGQNTWKCKILDARFEKNGIWGGPNGIYTKYLNIPFNNFFENSGSFWNPLDTLAHTHQNLKEISTRKHWKSCNVSSSWMKQPRTGANAQKTTKTQYYIVLSPPRPSKPMMLVFGAHTGTTHSAVPGVYMFGGGAYSARHLRQFNRHRELPVNCLIQAPAPATFLALKKLLPPKAGVCSRKRSKCAQRFGLGA